MASEDETAEMVAPNKKTKAGKGKKIQGQEIEKTDARKRWCSEVSAAHYRANLEDS
jgi:hypothetical protein